MRVVLLLLLLGCGSHVRPDHPRRLVEDAPNTCSDCAEWNKPVRGFQVFGNTYYVGVHGLSSVLVTSDAGHILVDGALPQSAALIDANIRALGFRTEDIKLILTSHAHFDHVGGVAALARFTGATVVSSAAGARALERGLPTEDDPQFAMGPIHAFPAVPRVQVVADREAVRVGQLAITAHYTPGHTPGATTWTWQSCEGARCVNVVYADSLNAVSADGFRFTGDAKTPSIADSFRASITRVGELPCDVLLTVHPSFGRLHEKLAARTADRNPFVEPGECKHYTESALKRLEGRIANEQK